MLPSVCTTCVQQLPRWSCTALLHQSPWNLPPWIDNPLSQCAPGTCRQYSSHHEQQQQNQPYAQYDYEHNEPAVDKQQLLRELIRKTHAAETTMAQVLAGQQLILRSRPDAAFFADQEKEALGNVQQLLPRYRVRPSALLPALQGAGLAAGAAAALAPPAARNAVLGALQESLTQLYNEQLRLMREFGLSDEAADVRGVVVKLRNLERAAEGSPTPPDIMSLSLQKDSLASVGFTGVLGAVVKAVADAATAASGKV